MATIRFTDPRNGYVRNVDVRLQRNTDVPWVDVTIRLRDVSYSYSEGYKVMRHTLNLLGYEPYEWLQGMRIPGMGDVPLYGWVDVNRNKMIWKIKLARRPRRIYRRRNS